MEMEEGILLMVTYTRENAFKDILRAKANRLLPMVAFTMEIGHKVKGTEKDK